MFITHLLFWWILLNPYTLYSVATQSLPHALQHTEIENYYMIFNVRYIGPIEWECSLINFLLLEKCVAFSSWKSKQIALSQGNNSWLLWLEVSVIRFPWKFTFAFIKKDCMLHIWFPVNTFSVCNLKLISPNAPSLTQNSSSEWQRLPHPHPLSNFQERNIEHLS